MSHEFFSSLPVLDAMAGETVVAELLDQQRTLTAVDRFAQRHAALEAPLLEKRYRDLLDITDLRDGEQLAFEVDLDACSGCKACVAACHRLNGLEEDETWRDVGRLLGFTEPADEGPTSWDSPFAPEGLPLVQHVTSACHHCVDPACLAGCPVQAYEKDAVTGIVRHLDDQCIGCQYCTWMCPYNVPQYSSQKGIVRKCDMCHQRLAVGEAPACVQSCPNEAIRIVKVDRDETRRRAETGLLLPEAPPSTITTPSTRYVTRRSGATGPAVRFTDSPTLEPQHAHGSLIVMLVLTQMSVGMLVLTSLAASPASPQVLIAAAMAGMSGVVAASFHLGRPAYGFRAFLGLRTSWLSREVVLMGGFAGLLPLLAAGRILLPTWQMAATLATVLGALTGFAAVGSSAMIYVATQRPYWSAARTFLRFGSTTLALGATALAIAHPRPLWLAIVAAVSLLQLVFSQIDAAAARSVSASTSDDRDPRQASLRDSKRLLAGPLRVPFTVFQLSLAFAGLVLAPIALLVGPDSIAAPLLATALLVARLAADVLDRYLFFRAVVPFRMPGA